MPLLLRTDIHVNIGPNDGNEGPAGREGMGAAGAGRRQGRRNIRMRLAALQRARGELYRVEEDEEASSSEDDDEPDTGVEEGLDKKISGKMGTKKLKRIQEKAERRQMREVCGQPPFLLYRW